MSLEIFFEYYMSEGLGIYFLILIGIFFFGLYRKKQLSSGAMGVWLIVSISLMVELLGRYLLFAIGTTAPTEHTINFLHFIAYGYTFSKYAVNKKLARSFWVGGLLLACYSAVNSIWIQDFFQSPSRSTMVFNVAIVLGSLITFFDMIKKPSQIPLLKQGLFWFNTATLFFYSITFFSFALHDHYLAQYYETGEYMPNWAIALIKGMNYYMYTSYFIAIWLDSKRTVKS